MNSEEAFAWLTEERDVPEGDAREMMCDARMTGDSGTHHGVFLTWDGVMFNGYDA